jgi:hypothetical protein
VSAPAGKRAVHGAYSQDGKVSLKHAGGLGDASTTAAKRIIGLPTRSVSKIEQRARRNAIMAYFRPRDPRERRRVTEEHYNLSTNLSAGEEYALITKSYREHL